MGLLHFDLGQLITLVSFVLIRSAPISLALLDASQLSSITHILIFKSRLHCELVILF